MILQGTAGIFGSAFFCGNPGLSSRSGACHFKMRRRVTLSLLGAASDIAVVKSRPI
jgi:hypothetical protein